MAYLGTKMITINMLKLDRTRNILTGMLKARCLEDNQCDYSEVTVTEGEVLIIVTNIIVGRYRRYPPKFDSEQKNVIEWRLGLLLDKFKQPSFGYPDSIMFIV